MALAFEKIKKLYREVNWQGDRRQTSSLSPRPGFERTSQGLKGAGWPVEVLVGHVPNWRASVLGHLWDDMV